MKDEDESSRWLAFFTWFYRDYLRMPVVSIDLNATDDQLRTAFDSWIREKRKETLVFGLAPPIKRKITDKDLADWSAKRVLAFIDLGLLQEVHDIALPNHLIGELLFPDDLDTDVSERVRKVVQPLADRLIHADTLGTLRVAAEAECKLTSE